MKKRFALAALVLAFGAFACQMAEAAETVTVGILKIAALTDAWVAKENGIFAKNGLDVKLIQFRNGNEAISAQRSGSVDIILSIPGTAMTAVERGFDLVLLSQNEIAKSKGPDTGSLVVLANSPYKKLSDLKGKRIAVSGLHSQMTVSTKVALEKGGVDMSKMQVIEMPFSTMGDALKAKQIDAAALLDPWVTELSKEGVTRNLSWLYVDAIPEQPLGGWYTSKAFLSKHKDAAIAFVKSIHEAIDYMNADKQRARKDVARFTGLKPKLLDAMPLISWDYHINMNRWQAVVDMMYKNGELMKPHKASEYISDIAQQSVLKD